MNYNQLAAAQSVTAYGSGNFIPLDVWDKLSQEGRRRLHDLYEIEMEKLTQRKLNGEFDL